MLVSSTKGWTAAALAALLAMTACQAEEPTPAPTATTAPSPTATSPAATPTQAATAQAPAPTAAATAAPAATQAPSTPTPAGTPLPPGAFLVTVYQVGGSGQTGTMVLVPKGAQTDAVIDVKPGAAGVAQPTHLHDAECQSPPKVIHRLTSLTDGKPTTTLNVALADLQKQPLALCIHKSSQESATYVAAGVLPTEAKGFAVAISDLKHLIVTVPPGTTVAWINADSVPHTVTSGTGGQADGKWDSPQMAAAAVYRQTFTQTGSFSYTCKVHPSMTGSVRVVEGAQPSATTPTTGSSDPYNY